ncbi:MAG: 50S ribosomal protein L11 methyltransferase [Ignavibacteria bacterium]|nr:50S ribosomal protein L11 methyltransferase [Ignavibacteria bacterium]
MSTETIYIQFACGDMERREELQALLLPYAPLGFLDEDTVWQCYFDRASWEAAREGGILDRFAAMSPAHPVDVMELRQENWNRAWEESITPIRVSDRFVIAPTWHPAAPEPGVIVLTIDPKMSFGTGYHQTTRLMMRLLEGAIRGGERVLDVGTGTGVLAIAAVALGAAEAVGVDTDEWSKDNAEENIARNGMEGRVRVHHGSIEHADGRFDVICSNITRNDNIAMFPAFAGLLNPEGILLLSGFTPADLDDIRDAARAEGFTPLDAMLEDDWAALDVRLSTESS